MLMGMIGPNKVAGAAAAVQFGSIGTAGAGAGGSPNFSVTDLTIGAGSNQALIGTIDRITAATPNPFIIWDFGTSGSNYNQALTVISSITPLTTQALTYGLVNPHQGNLNARFLSSGTTIIGNVLYFNNVYQGGGAASFTGSTQAGDFTDPSTFVVTGGASDWQIGVVDVEGGNLTSINQTQIMYDNSIHGWGAAYATAGGASTTFSAVHDAQATWAGANLINGSGGGLGPVVGNIQVDATDSVEHYIATATGYTDITVGSGSNRFILLALAFDGVVPSSQTVKWGSQTMQLIQSSDNGANISAQLWGLCNPTSGAQAFTINWTGGQHVFAKAISFTGVDQSNNSTTWPNGTSSSGFFGNVISSIPGQYLFSSIATGGGIGPTGNILYSNNTTGSIINAGAGYQFCYVGGPVFTGNSTNSVSLFVASCALKAA
jgi:hypothetical protein